MTQEIRLTHPQFDNDVAKLLKKYPNVEKDIENFARLLDSAPAYCRGHSVPGFGQMSIYKARVMSQDLGSGKSAGWRVILYYEPELDDYVFLSIYTHKGSSSSQQRREDKIMKEVQHRLATLPDYA